MKSLPPVQFRDALAMSLGIHAMLGLALLNRPGPSSESPVVLPVVIEFLSESLVDDEPPLAETEDIEAEPLAEQLLDDDARRRARLEPRQPAPSERKDSPQPPERKERSEVAEWPAAERDWIDFVRTDHLLVSEDESSDGQLHGLNTQRTEDQRRLRADRSEGSVRAIESAEGAPSAGEAGQVHPAATAKRRTERAESGASGGDTAPLLESDTLSLEPGDDSEETFAMQFEASRASQSGAIARTASTSTAFAAGADPSEHWAPFAARVAVVDPVDVAEPLEGLDAIAMVVAPELGARPQDATTESAKAPETRHTRSEQLPEPESAVRKDSPRHPQPPTERGGDAWDATQDPVQPESADAEAMAAAPEQSPQVGAGQRRGDQTRQPRASQPGMASIAGAPGAASVVTTDDLVRIDVDTVLNVAGHPLAPWFMELDDSLRERLEYPTELRVRAVHGTVVVGFVVRRSGRVQDVHLVRPSGQAELDAQALAAIPGRVAPPRPLEGSSVAVRYTFRYGVD